MGLAALKVVLLLKNTSKGFHVVTKFLCLFYFMLCLILVTFCVVVKFELVVIIGFVVKTPIHPLLGVFLDHWTFFKLCQSLIHFYRIKV